ncbi:single-stranded-DNA-specific exonuclease RecJ [Candidatus Tenderia electrophaga]|jgi:single-stranded-DNA-specific exonuclease|uniref:Single-stranded-DNA-specific exonuclease RecJ n=1 Tax=Candidatus Tenderia electrophaga TaxID=1748243 RepID=A0A0S2TCY8_9GAMM|nr:single-stranded-DNA-specific exonuclease RecJ [Candidatus Tenderia electrophaga]
MTVEILRRAVPDNWHTLFPDLHPVLARVYAGRQVASERELETGLDRLPPPQLMKGMAQAVAVLARAVEDGRRILVVGDFDADGATSTALALRALRLLGAADVQFLVPNRFEYGYGLTPEIVAVAAARAPDVIVTVDNGIASLDGVRAARAHGMQVVVTDHHLPGATLPEAEAIVNPNQPGCQFPSKSLAGVGVIFYVMLALRAALRDNGWFQRRSLESPNLAQLLDIVALGTVADVVPLDHINRILVAQGLARIRSGRCCPGIQALLEVAGRRGDTVVAADMGFAVGPRLNAAGRLQDMSLGIQCLLTDDPQQARALAAELDGLNRRRRAIEDEMRDQALHHLQALQLEETAALPAGLCLFHEEWHQGVIGILAARIKERYHRPVIAFAAADDDHIKGSARSVAGFHIRDGLEAVATRCPGLVQKFGGHAMAAGLTVKRTDFEDFVCAFDAEVRRHLAEDDLRGRVWSDGALNGADLNLGLAESLRQAGPWGQGFPEPVFDGEFRLLKRRIVGERHLKLTLQTDGAGQVLDAIAFNVVDDAWPADVAMVKMAYKLDVNHYRDSRTLQLMVEHIEPLAATTPS